MYQRLKDILEKSLSNKGIEKKLLEKRAVSLWEEVAGKSLSEHTKAITVRNGLLFVEVSSPVWANQIQFLKNELIKKINTKIGKKIISEIRFQPGKIEKSNFEEKKASIDKEPDYTLVYLEDYEVMQVEKSLKEISDENLREEMRRILIKQRKLDKIHAISGWEKCIFCGTLYPKTKDECDLCSVKKIEEKVRDFLYFFPWMNEKDIADFFWGIRIEGIQKTRESLLSELSIEIRETILNFLKQKDVENIAKLRMDLQVYTMLSKRIKPCDLKENDFYDIIDKDAYRMIFAREG